MAEWTLRCRGPQGQATLSGVKADMTVQAFQELLASKTGVPANQQQLLIGFPPKPLTLPDSPADVLLSSLPLCNGESITVNALPPPPPAPAATPQATSQPQDSNGRPAATLEDDEEADLARAIAMSLVDSASSAAAPTAPNISTSNPPQPPSTSSNSPPRPAPAPGPAVSSRSVTNAPRNSNSPAATSVDLSDHSGRAVVRRVIESDNSCLFNAVGYVMEGTRSKAPELRRVIAKAVREDPFTYNEAFLGMENDKYCNWICQPDKWGGAIELSILSTHYGREIAAYDIQTCRCDIYGQDAGFSERVMLIYDGLHYDAMAVAAFAKAPEEIDQTIYTTCSVDTPVIEEAARQLVESCHKARQFTDTANFTLRCGVCQIGLKGEKEAVEHAKQTGHQNFSEY